MADTAQQFPIEANFWKKRKKQGCLHKMKCIVYRILVAVYRVYNNMLLQKLFRSFYLMPFQETHIVIQLTFTTTIISSNKPELDFFWFSKTKQFETLNYFNKNVGQCWPDPGQSSP